MVRAIQSRKVQVDFGLVLQFEVPETMTDDEALMNIFKATGGEGDPLHGTHLSADVVWCIGQTINTNLKGMGATGLKATGDSTLNLTKKETD